MNEISGKFSLAEKLCLSCTSVLFQNSISLSYQYFGILKVEHLDFFLETFWVGGEGSCLKNT